MIPNILHMYWGRNKPLSYLRYMTAVSFADLNPDWQIIVHYPEEPHKGITWRTGEHRASTDAKVDYFPLLSEIDGCETRPFDFTGIENAPGLPEVIRSDLARWHLLATVGGWWADFDILFVRQMSSLSVPKSTSVVGARQINRFRQHVDSVGFLGSDGSAYASTFFKDVLRTAQRNCDPSQYESTGKHAFMPVRMDREADPELCILPPEIVYPVQAWDAVKLYDNDLLLTDKTIGIHWFAGHPRSARFEAQAIPAKLSRLSGGLARHLWARANRRAHAKV